LQVLWSRLWNKNLKVTTFSLNVMMFLHLLFSLNCLIPLQVTTWHPFLCWWNCQKSFFNLMPLCCHNHPPLWGIFSLLSLAYMWWCYQDKPQMSCGLWIIIRSIYEKSNSCRLFSMGTSCLNCCKSIWMLTTLPKCKAWIKSSMAMLGISWSQPI